MSDAVRPRARLATGLFLGAVAVAAVVTYLVHAGVAFWATCVAPRMFLSSGLAQLPTPVGKAPEDTDRS